VKAARGRDELSSGLSRMGDQRGPIAELLAQLLTVNPSKRITSVLQCIVTRRLCRCHPWCCVHGTGCGAEAPLDSAPPGRPGHDRRQHYSPPQQFTPAAPCEQCPPCEDRAQWRQSFVACTTWAPKHDRPFRDGRP